MARILQWNIRGIISKHQKLNNILIKHNIDAAIISEPSSTVREYINPTNKINPAFFPSHHIIQQSTDNLLLIRKDHYKLGTSIIFPTVTNVKTNLNAIGFSTIINSIPINLLGFYRTQKAKSITPLTNYIDTIQATNNNPILIGGDVNLLHNLWGGKTNEPLAQELIEYLHSHDFTCLNNGVPTHKQGNPLDITFLYNNYNNNHITWSIKTHWNHQFSISDHHPILTTINHQQKPNIPHTTWNLCSNYWEKYTKLTQETFTKLQIPSTPITNINKLNDIITQTIKQCAFKTIGIKNKIKSNNPWITPKILHYQTLYKKYNRKYHKKSSFNGYYYYKKQIYKSKIQYQIKQNKINYNKTLNKILSNSNLCDKLFWKTLNRLDIKPKNTILDFEFKDQNDKTTHIIKNPQLKTQLLLRNVLNPPTPPETPQSKILYYQHLKMYHQITQQQQNSPSNKYSYILNDPIQHYELNNTIATLTSDSAMGIDKIHNLFLINASTSLKNTLLYLFNKCLSSGTIPQIWNCAHISFLPKPNKLHTNYKNYRPLSITSSIYRLYSKILTNRLQSYVLFNNYIHENNAGFQINRNTMDTFLPLHETILSNSSNQQATYLIKSDFSKAYDTVSIPILINKLSQMYQIDSKFLKTINHILTHHYVRTSVDNFTSKWNIQNVGIPQGDPISPLLFILFINDFKLKPELNVSLSGFADDLIFYNSFNPQISKQQSILNMQKALNYFHNWCLINKLVLNPQKCKQTHIYHIPETIINNLKLNQPSTNLSQHILQHPHRIYYLNKYNSFQHTFTLPTSPSPTPIKKDSDHIRYLGLFFTKFYSFEPHYQKVTQYFQNTLSYLIKLNKKYPLKLPTYITIFKATCWAKYDYGAPLYLTPKRIHNLQIIQNKILRYSLNAKKSTPIPLLHLMTKCMYLKYRYHQKCLNLYTKLKYVPSHHPLFNTNSINTNHQQYIHQYNIQYPHKKIQKHHLNQSIINITQQLTKQYDLFITKTKINPAPISIKAPPILTQTLNTNIITNEEPIHMAIPENCEQYYIDGSINKNPGFGGFGIYKTPSIISPPIFHVQIIPWLSEINTNELLGLLQTIIIILQYHNYPQTLIIYTDSLNVIKWIAKTQYTISFDKYIIIKDIINKLNILSTHVQTIYINKVKAHTNIIGNEIADKLAKMATKLYNTIDYDIKKEWFHQVSYNTQLAEIHQQIQQKTNKKEWEPLKKHQIKILNSQPIQYINKWYLMIHDTINSKMMFHALSTLNRKNLKIINRIISQHLDLNHYQFEKKYKNHEIHQGYCPWCTPDPNNLTDLSIRTYETIEHFLFKCFKYKKERTIMYNNIKNLDKNLWKQIIINHNYIIYPYIITKDLKIIHQIWTYLSFYVKATNRLPITYFNDNLDI